MSQSEDHPKEHKIRVDSDDESNDPKDSRPSMTAARMSDAINNILSTNIDWTKLTGSDLKKFYVMVTKPSKLRTLAVRLLKNRLKTLGKAAKDEARVLIRDTIEDSKVASMIVNFLYGEDEDSDRRA